MENRPIAVIVTGAGAPGIQGTLYSLKQNYDNRSFHVIGTDINDFVVGKYLCDEFCVISPAKKEEEYLSDLMSICKDRNVKAILPQNTAELLLLAKHKKMFSRRPSCVRTCCRLSAGCAGGNDRTKRTLA